MNDEGRKRDNTTTRTLKKNTQVEEVKARKLEPARKNARVEKVEQERENKRDYLQNFGNKKTNKQKFRQHG